MLTRDGFKLETTRQDILNELDPNFEWPSKEQEIAEKPSDLQNASGSKLPKPEPMDLSQRYDVYCNQLGEAVVHHNVLLKGVKSLFASYGDDTASLYLELEPADGKALFVPEQSVFKFCDPGANAGGAPVPKPDAS